jgi:hypothetical protein
VGGHHEIFPSRETHPRSNTSRWVLDRSQRRLGRQLNHGETSDGNRAN